MRLTCLGPFPQDRESTLLAPSAADRALLGSLNALDATLYARAAEMAELDFEYFRQVELIAESGGDPAAVLLGPAVPDQSEETGEEAREYLSKHIWKANPNLPDPDVTCKATCGFICQVKFPDVPV